MQTEEQKEYQKKWRAENKEHMKEYAQKYYADNAEQRRQKARAYYKDHREERRAYLREYNASHQEQRREYNKKIWREGKKEKDRVLWETPEGRAYKLLRTSRSMARRRRGRSMSFSLTIDDILPAIQRGICAVTGIPFVLDDPRSPWRPSIDRIDNDKDYLPENVQIVAWIYNVAKSNFSHDDVLILSQSLIGKEAAT